MDACQECADAELAAEIAKRDAEIAALRQELERIKTDVRLACKGRLEVFDILESKE